MNQERYSQVLFGKDIVNIIEEYVQQTAKEYWSTDDCPPKFWVSLNNVDMNNQKIMITIDHLGRKFTEVLFPRSNTEYGYSLVLYLMENMYNQTM